MKCPKDGETMEEMVADNVVLDCCPKCNGIWVDKGELKKVAGFVATEHELMYRGDSNRICPRCAKRMNKADLHSTIVEECKCGLFFDAGEVRKVLGRELDLRTDRIELTSAQVEQLKAKGSLRVGPHEIVIR